ncbi:hypothetical protein FRC14_007325 [Serendipita sp. 396]|nr:hypothetical protein FRC14_007325 [Serendipita sp. 396]KAG8775512.1 hypothetical protein FRC15_000479 [Serendipita sp. 397]KAG8791025.1 hypothetical protein FRC16_000626 [Serendipita sp. 398]KAG8845602.1 hypothetical protein FRB91_001627 [Serendipita sp. 411]KAG8860484.1 hypothetical protein FRC20_011608 [Serendipita sp. 405]
MVEWTWDYPGSKKLQQSIFWGFTPRTLTLSRIIHSVFLHSLLQGVVDLTIIPGTKWVGEYRKTTQIVMHPRLVRLKLKGSWIELLQGYAPVLEYLVLRIIDNGESIVRAARYLLHTLLRS